MNETLLFPSPNWFQSSGLVTTNDGWIVYGGPSKSLCVLQPLNADVEGVLQEKQRYRAHVVNRAHGEKIVSVDVTPAWPEKKCIISGSSDGSVKQWTLEEFEYGVKFKSTHSHDIHLIGKEELSGTGYSDEVYAITVGTFGNIVRWDLNTNVVKKFSTFLKTFKPTCLACSRHILLNVAVGTKQGVIFVLDLSGQGKVLYKVRGQDDEIISVSWCPKYEVLLRKTLKESQRKSSINDRMEKIRLSESNEKLDKSAVSKSLPEDSFDESIVQEDDTFDIYKDHEADEFGHKKFEPIDVFVKVKEESEPVEFLKECSNLKDDILKRKNDGEQSIESLVNALEKTHVDSKKTGNVKTADKCRRGTESSAHPQKHLLATIGKHGGVRIWSKTGKLVASCVVASATAKNTKNKGTGSVTLHWYKPDLLLIGDGKSQLLETNPLKLDGKNKLEWRVVHSLHKRGLFCISSNAPRGQADNSTEKWRKQLHVWTAAQDRNIICYSMEKREKIATFNTCGGFVYNAQSCPYDANKVAISVGDGAVRVWEGESVDDDESKFHYGKILSFWQNVQGKVLTVAWHPTRENLLAFATAESRVGVVETGGNKVRAARALLPALRGGVYSLCWGAGSLLYASGGGELVCYDTDAPDRDPVSVKIQFEGKSWELSAVSWGPFGLMCGSVGGAVALLSDDYEVRTAVFVFSKMIHYIQWHPQQTTYGSEESAYKNIIAVSSLDKNHNISLLQYNENADIPVFNLWKTLSGHKSTVLQVSWDPHNDGRLLSTSADSTIRVWDMSLGECVSIFGGHSQSALCAEWSAMPSAGLVLSGGADCCLRLWQPARHPAAQYQEIIHETATKKKKNKTQEEKKETEDPIEENVTNGQMAATSYHRAKGPKKFLLPVIYKQAAVCKLSCVRKMAQKFLPGDTATNGDTYSDTEDFDMDFLKVFGSTNDVNEILDIEMTAHLENDRLDAWTMLAIFRGHIDAMIQYSSRHDRLCPFLVSLAPCVSFKYWKDVTQLYLAQINRQVAKGDADKSNVARPLGGWVYRRAALQLGAHEPRAAAGGLADLRLYKEAYVLARARHLDNIAAEMLKMWGADAMKIGHLSLAAVCFLALDDPYGAATVLSKSNEEDYLSLAAELAKVAGQLTFASNIVDKKTQILNGKSEVEPEEELPPLPQRADLIIGSLDEKQNGDVESD